MLIAHLTLVQLWGRAFIQRITNYRQMKLGPLLRITQDTIPYVVQNFLHVFLIQVINFWDRIRPTPPELTA